MTLTIKRVRALLAAAATVMAAIALPLGAFLARPPVARAQATATPAATAQPVPAASDRQVTVVGRAAVDAVPDSAIVRIGVVTTAPTATLALERNSQQTSAVVSAITDAGLPERSIQTGAIQVFPIRAERGQPPVGGQREPLEITGYEVTNMLQVTIGDLAQLGDVLGTAVEAGANQVYGVQMQVSNRDAVRTRTRADAYRDARVQAQQLAQAAGAVLGEALLIDATDSAPMPLPVGAAESRGGSVPVQPGVETVEATVRVTFALQPAAQQRSP